MKHKLLSAIVSGAMIISLGAFISASTALADHGGKNEGQQASISSNNNAIETGTAENSGHGDPGENENDQSIQIASGTMNPTASTTITPTSTDNSLQETIKDSGDNSEISSE